MSGAIKVEHRDAVMELTIARPKANAIDVATSQRMGEVLCEFRDDPNLRVAIITGDGDKFFSAGWDLKAVAEGTAGFDDDYGPGGFAGITELHDLDKPVICAVNGLAVGGGFEIALSSDIIVAAEHAEFFLPEIQVGVVADAATFRLPRRIPRAIAVEMLLTGRRMSAAEARDWGLVNAVVAADDLMDEARKMASTIAQGAPLVVAAVKEMLRKTEDQSIPACYRMLHDGVFEGYQRMMASPDAAEGPKSFAEKRDPQWKQGSA